MDPPVCGARLKSVIQHVYQGPGYSVTPSDVPLALPPPHWTQVRLSSCESWVRIHIFQAYLEVLCIPGYDPGQPCATHILDLDAAQRLTPSDP